MWRASRPAPSAIWWRQLVPQAASGVAGGALLADGYRAARPLDRVLDGEHKS
jgi:hypothetical protein